MFQMQDLAEESKLCTFLRNLTEIATESKEQQTKSVKEHMTRKAREIEEKEVSAERR